MRVEAGRALSRNVPVTTLPAYDQRVERSEWHAQRGPRLWVGQEWWRSGNSVQNQELWAEYASVWFYTYSGVSCRRPAKTSETRQTCPETSQLSRRF